MDRETAAQIRRKKDDIARLNREINELADGCGSWFQPAGEAEGIQCGHGAGHCPNCAKDTATAERIATAVDRGIANPILVFDGQPIIGFAEGDEEIHVERDEYPSRRS